MLSHGNAHLRHFSSGDDEPLISLLVRLLPSPDRRVREMLGSARRRGQGEALLADLEAASVVRRVEIGSLDELADTAPRAVCLLKGGNCILLEPADGEAWSVATAHGTASRLVRPAALHGLFPCEAVVAQNAEAGRADVVGPPPDRRPMPVVGVYLRLVSQLLGLTTPIAMMLIIDKVVSQGARNTLMALLAGVALLTAFQYLFLFSQTLHASREAEMLALPMRHNLLRRLLGSPRGRSWASVGWDVMLGCHESGRFQVETRPQAAADVGFVALLAVLMAAFSSTLLTVSLAFVPLYVLLEVWAGRRAERHAEGTTMLRNQLSARYFESVAATDVVRSLNLSDHLVRQWDDADVALAGARYRLMLCRRLSAVGVEFLQKLSLIVIMLLGVGAVIAGSMTLGQYIAFNLLSMQLAQPVLRLAAYRRARLDQTLLRKSLQQIERGCAEAAWPAAGDRLAPVGEASFLEVAGVNVGAGSPVEFVLRAGDWLGIVGPSGCGKSTLLRDLAGLHEPLTGGIRLNGLPIRQLDLAHRSRLIRLVPQDAVLFSASIAENIHLGDLSAAPRQIVTAADVCGLGPLLESLPEHLNTIVGAAGRPLSGGERQRVAIARAILVRPRVLLLDEATAALDAPAETALLTELRRHLPDCAVVMVSHRPSSLAHCQHILRLGDSVGTADVEVKPVLSMRSAR